jgi:dipeptidyl aminopeptidase/acylaminoacyl peptidase
LTSSPRGVQQLAWSPDSKTIAFATQDELEKKPGFERWNRSFEVTLNTDYTMTEAVPPTHLWMVAAAGGDPKRLTSGTWTMPISHPPGTPASAIVWTPDGAGIVFTRNVAGRGARSPARTCARRRAGSARTERGRRAFGRAAGAASVISITPLGGNGRPAVLPTAR